MFEILFIGNCQIISLCVFMQELMTKHRCTNVCVQWIRHGEEFIQTPTKWVGKLKIRHMDPESYIDLIPKMDVILYQEMTQEHSKFCNQLVLTSLIKSSCRLIRMSSYRLDDWRIEDDLIRLERRENEKQVDLCISPIIKRNLTGCMLDYIHPSTWLILEILREVCAKLNIPFFSQPDYTLYMENQNYMELPVMTANQKQTRRDFIETWNSHPMRRQVNKL